MTQEPELVKAAGILPWRLNEAGELEVLLIHRPHYDDWSWPKGKLNRGETLPECAIREGAEETGEQFILGRPLRAIGYKINGGKRRKRVWYWAARCLTEADSQAVRMRPPPRPSDPFEVDKMRWVSPAKAAKKLSRKADRNPLEDLVQAHEAGLLATESLAVIRHASAKKRSSWKGDELTRPLTPTGRGQAVGLVPLLSAYGALDVLTSQWQRCWDTVEPFCRYSGLFPVTSDHLTEAEHEKSPSRVANAVVELMTSPRASAICTHRPVLPTILDVLAQHSARKVAEKLPTKDPYLQPGEALVLHVAYTPAGPRVVDVERHRPVL